MITNDRQFRIVKSQIEEFEKSLEMMSQATHETKDVHPLILEAEKEAVVYELQNLQKQAKEYENLKEGKIIVSEVNDLKELPLLLIKARIANGLTQADLASRLGMKEQQIQKYEAEQFGSASLRTLLKIAENLKISIEGDVQLRVAEDPGIYEVKKYPIRQMYRRNWFPAFGGTLNEAVMNSGKLISDLFQAAGLENMERVLNRRSVRTSVETNNEALNVWYARVIIKAREQELLHFFDKNIVDADWLRRIASFTIENDGPRMAVRFLSDSGVRVVFEQQMEGTQLDGAALLLDNVYPVIALTLRYDRLDNFWFVLFHELAHIMLHLNADLDAIFDDLDAYEGGIEKEADNFALNIAIPDTVWKKSLVRFSPSKETIVNVARSLNVHPAIVAGRIRWESKNFFLFSDLVGQGEVRNKFSEELK